MDIVDSFHINEANLNIYTKLLKSKTVLSPGIILMH